MSSSNYRSPIRLLGHWEEAAHDLALDEEASAVLKVQPGAQKTAEHQGKYEEREMKERMERAEKALEEYERAWREGEARRDQELSVALFQMAFLGEMPGPNETLRDPEVLAALQDPEAVVAFQDLAQDPANKSKYQSNPKVGNLISKLSATLGGSSVMTF